MVDTSSNDPQILIDKLSDEVSTKKALVTSVLPKEISQLDQYIASLVELENTNSISNESLNQLESRAKILSKEINAIKEKKKLKQDQSDDKIRIIQQNVSMNILIDMI